MIIDNVKKNWQSGLTVALVSIPLSVSLAVASNATPLVGIITAIWAGLIAAVFGGSNFNIVGPTGALSGIIATYVITNGAGSLPVLAITSGIIILVSYAFKLERYLILIPSSVIHGFTLGVAFIIGLGQLNFAFGLNDILPQESFFANTIESLKHFGDISWPAFLIFTVFLIGLFVCKKIVPKIPGAIILAPVGIVLGYLSNNGVVDFPLQTLGEKFTDISFKFFVAPEFVFSLPLMKTAAVVALVAILETMLSAKIADGMTKTKHNERKEMFGLGLANIISGLMGGMPATAALARTSLNVKTGANHKSSAVINGLGVAAISFFLLGYFSFIPMAVIASILVFVAVQMVETENYAKFWRYERANFFVSIFVAGVTLVEDPILGILSGAVISLLIFVNRLSKGSFDLKVNKFDEGIIDSISGEKIGEIEENADVLLYSIRGKLCYINSRAHVARFETNLIKYKYIILRLREVYFMDLDGIEALDEIFNIVESRGQQVILTSVNQGVLNLPQFSMAYKKLKERNLIFNKSEYALQYLGLPLAK